MTQMMSFVGGMNVPTRGWGRMNATSPLAELAIGEETLTFRPRLFARLRRLMPIGMVGATVLLVVAETRTQAPLLWRIWVGFVYAVAMDTAILRW